MVLIAGDSRAFMYVIADDGRILERLNRTFSEALRYRVWAPLGGNDGSISIPVVGISSADGTAIKNALGVGAVAGDASRAGRVRGADRDGTVDNAIVAHEWGHYFHHRLSFCGGTQQCGAMSEGWGDFMVVLAEAFARRGAGTAAVSPSRSSESMDGVVESYDIAGEIAVRSVALPGDLDCDEDGNWDGGVIEISTDGGSSWQDVGTIAGYDGVLTDESGNPLGGRNAYAGESAGYPSMTTKALSFGNQFAGQSVKIRFRIGTDAGVGGDGWEIDNIRVAGITNTPFATIGDDAGSCDGIIEPPISEEGGCGCQSSRGTGGSALLLLLAFALVGRRRRTR